MWLQILLVVSALLFANISRKTLALCKVCETKVDYFDKVLIERLRYFNQQGTANTIRSVKIVETWRAWIAESRSHALVLRQGVMLIIVYLGFTTGFGPPHIFLALFFCGLVLVLGTLYGQAVFCFKRHRAIHIDKFGGLLNSVVDMLEQRYLGRPFTQNQQDALNTMLDRIGDEKYWKRIKQLGSPTSNNN